ncbi:SGNH/GDSL hydrolase family protein [Pararhizobium haloflavum]|uniref:SGNH/GDSL hydrolase family protein n=1 Tax=Pararhizobium haloflavum TaxID=2037914 RepID=UPI000C18AE5F|nr:SGNH/GDSL hydrolase family protein [Pararhizobium haloflavum]
MSYRFHGLLSWLCVPLALFYANRVRRTVPRLSPPVGPTLGRVGRTGDPRFRILVVGDSSAAGVGAAHMDETLAPKLARRLADRYSTGATWRTAGSNSATTEELRDHVAPNIVAEPYTHIVILAGTNDMKNFLPRRRFDDGFGGLLFALHAKWPQATLIWSPVIDMRTVPALPPVLGHILEWRVKMVNELGRQLCRERFAIAAPQLEAHDPEGFAVDGFHASAKGYSYWADLVADVVIEAEERKVRGLYPVKEVEAEIPAPDMAMPGE